MLPPTPLLSPPVLSTHCLVSPGRLVGLLQGPGSPLNEDKALSTPTGPGDHSPGGLAYGWAAGLQQGACPPLRCLVASTQGLWIPQFSCPSLHLPPPHTLPV